jgi:hypothetical protein
MPSEEYDEIKPFIEAEEPMKAKHKGESGSRKLWPMLLGRSKNKDDEWQEMVLCYQVNADPKLRGWRCFIVTDLDHIGPVSGPMSEDRPEMTPEDISRQSCVVEVQVPPPVP